MKQTLPAPKAACVRNQRPKTSRAPEVIIAYCASDISRSVSQPDPPLYLLSSNFYSLLTYPPVSHTSSQLLFVEVTCLSLLKQTAFSKDLLLVPSSHCLIISQASPTVVQLYTALLMSFIESLQYIPRMSDISRSQLSSSHTGDCTLPSKRKHTSSGGSSTSRI